MQLWERLTRAGGLFPLALCGLMILTLPFTVLPSGNLVSLASRAWTVVFAAPFLFVAGLVWVGLVAGAITPALALILRLCRERPGRDRVGRLAGSLVASAAVGPLALYGNDPASADVSWLFLLALGLAIATGQAYGSLAGVDDLRRRRRGRLPSTPYRFTTWRLMAAMIPLSVLLSVLRALDLVNGAAAVYLGVCTLLAAATWAPVAWLMNHSLDRRLRRRRAERLC